MIITSVSDCHGDFQESEIGELNTSTKLLDNLELLTERTNDK